MLSDHSDGFRCALQDARRMERLTSPLEGDMGDIYRKLSLVPPHYPTHPRAPPVDHPHHDEGYWLTGACSRPSGARCNILPRGPLKPIYPMITGQLTSAFRGSVFAQRDSAT